MNKKYIVENLEFDTKFKTEKEIEGFITELGSTLPYISENGSSIHGLNLINNNFFIFKSKYIQNYKKKKRNWKKIYLYIK